MEKELISLSIKDIETIKEVPDTLKQDLKAFITNAKDTERFVIWLTAQRLPLNLIQRYEYVCYVDSIDLEYCTLFYYLWASEFLWISR